MSDGLNTISLGKMAARTSSMLNLGRSNRHHTIMGWRPVEEGDKARMTEDYGAIVAGPDEKSLPAELKKGTTYQLQLDCVVSPKGYWLAVTPHPALLSLCHVQPARPLVEPATEAHRVTLYVTPRANMAASDVPAEAAYITIMS